MSQWETIAWGLSPYVKREVAVMLAAKVSRPIHVTLSERNMSLPTYQLPSHTGSSFRKARKFIKRSTSKKARYARKRLGEDAPNRIITGYVD